MVLLFSYVVFQSISVHSIMVTLSPPPWSTIWKSRQALYCSLSVSRAYTFTTEGASEEKECGGRGQEGRNGGGGRWWHYPAQSTQEKDLSLGLLTS